MFVCSANKSNLLSREPVARMEKVASSVNTTLRPLHGFNTWIYIRFSPKHLHFYMNTSHTSNTSHIDTNVGVFGYYRVSDE